MAQSEDELLGGDDELLDDGDELLDEDSVDAEEPADEADVDTGVGAEAGAAHAALFAEDRYPSAATCGTCHPKQYGEWSVSQHAYSQLSPIYMALNNTINVLANGSNGDFCLRCHNQVGANLGESSFVSNLERHPTSREGITCVVCHRVNKRYNKVSGRMGLVEGDLLQPVYGPMGNAEMERILQNRQEYRVVTEPDEPGRKIHRQVIRFENISTPNFCAACHDVTLFNGFRLEEAFSEYRMSPASANGVTCQDCHMGKEQGVASGYEYGPAAVVGGVPTVSRKLASHYFSGPDYSVIHPGIFPHNAEAQLMATLEEWLQFDYKAGWGTDEFEDTVADDYVFPERWQAIDDRYDAREILDTQFERLEIARQKRLEVLRNGYQVEDVVVEQADSGGIRFKLKLKNATDGHYAPTGFTGERLIWFEITVTDSAGTVVFKTGDRDLNGDLRDDHSSYVHAGALPPDEQLFSLQSRFVVQSGRGAELEQIVPIPYPFISLPRVLPSQASLILTGEPATERNHKQGIAPLDSRWAKYEIDGEALTGEGPYRAMIRMRSQMVPINLVLTIQGVGFDFNMSPRAVGDALVEGGDILWETELSFDVDG